jgi:hypothetical protein
MSYASRAIPYGGGDAGEAWWVFPIFYVWFYYTELCGGLRHGDLVWNELVEWFWGLTSFWGHCAGFLRWSRHRF